MVAMALAGIAAAAAVAGAATSVYGAMGQAKTQAAAANNQYIAGQFQMAGTDVQTQALGIQQQQQQLQIETQKKAIGFQQQQDDLRRVAANLDASRRSREEIRKGISARAIATSVAINQGAGDKGSSALGGAAGTISGRIGNNLMGVFQNRDIGNKIFDINKQISENYLSAQTQNSGLVAQSGGLQGQLLGIQKAIYSTGSNTALDYKSAAAYGSISAFGTGLSSLGGAIVKNQEALTNLSNYFSSAFGGSAQVADSTFGGFSSSGNNAAEVKF